MALTTAQILNTESDEDLLRLLQGELNALFPPESRRDNVVFLSRLQSAPVGLRAMAATFELDVSMALDDLAFHFVNHPDLDLYGETRSGLRELGATEAAEIFESAFAVIEPHWERLGEVGENEEFGFVNTWLEQKGIQDRIAPLNKRMWELIDRWPKHGLMQYWITYARENPARCFDT